MLRAACFALGTSIALWGGLLFHVDRVVLCDTDLAAALGSQLLDPPDWLPYTLTSCGVLTMLYAVALPRKGH